jgi:hypothetical protein
MQAGIDPGPDGRVVSRGVDKGSGYQASGYLKTFS